MYIQTFAKVYILRKIIKPETVQQIQVNVQGILKKKGRNLLV